MPKGTYRTNQSGLKGENGNHDMSLYHWGDGTFFPYGRSQEKSSESPADWRKKLCQKARRDADGLRGHKTSVIFWSL